MGAKHGGGRENKIYSLSAQRLFGCRTRTLIPVSPKLLQPELQANVKAELATAI